MQLFPFCIMNKIIENGPSVQTNVMNPNYIHDYMEKVEEQRNHESVYFKNT